MQQKDTGSFKLTMNGFQHLYGLFCVRRHLLCNCLIVSRSTMTRQLYYITVQLFELNSIWIHWFYYFCFTVHHWASNFLLIRAHAFLKQWFSIKWQMFVCMYVRDKLRNHSTDLKTAIPLGRSWARESYRTIFKEFDF